MTIKQHTKKKATVVINNRGFFIGYAVLKSLALLPYSRTTLTDLQAEYSPFY